MTGLPAGIGLGLSMNTSLLDILLASAVLIGVVRGVMEGGLQEVAESAGVVLGIWGGVVKSEAGSHFLETYLGVPESIGGIAGFVAVFIGIRFAVKVLASGASYGAGVVGFGGIDRLLGGAIGGLKAALTASLLLILLGQVGIPSSQMQSESRWYEPVRQTLPVTWSVAQTVFPGLASLENLPGQIGSAVSNRVDLDAISSGAKTKSAPVSGSSISVAVEEPNVLKTPKTKNAKGASSPVSGGATAAESFSFILGSIDSSDLRHRLRQIFRKIRHAGWPKKI